MVGVKVPIFSVSSPRKKKSGENQSTIIGKLTEGGEGRPKREEGQVTGHPEGETLSRIAMGTERS